MTDATQGHTHAHDPLVARAEEFSHSANHAAARARPSLLEASAAARALGASLVIAALWAGVYWALH